MKRADIKLGFSCNNNCIHCVIADKRGVYKDKTIDEIKDEITDAAKKGCDEVVLTGGEPSIRKDLLDIARHASQSGIKNIQMQTNGRMLSYKDFCRQVVNAGVTDFVVAVHGHVPELHDYITANAGGFLQTVTGIKNLKGLGQRVAINVVVSRPNYRNLSEIANLLVKLHVNQFQFAFVHPLGNAGKHYYSVVPRKSLAEPYVKKGLDIGINAGISCMTEAIPYCFMKGYEEFVAEERIPQTMIFDAECVIDDFTAQRINDGKKKSEGCMECTYNAVCEGPWREYPEHYGWDEFKPRMDTVKIAGRNGNNGNGVFNQKLLNMV